ncbi:MAG: pilus assembly protein TadG-related protein [Chloroflexota bacterium]
MPTPTAPAPAAESAASRPAKSLARRGQVLVVYVMSIFVIVGLLGLVIDVAWYWSNSLKVQRAADAAALAGAVDLPAKPGTTASHAIGTGIGDAIAEASKNGYPGITFGCAGDGKTPSSSPGICVRVDTGNVNQLDVMVSAPVNTFFMRIFGINSLTAKRDAAAVFTLPVPMGSPENYYGVFGPVRGATFTSTTTGPASSSWTPPTAIQGTAVWTTPTNADGTQNTSYAVSATTNGSQQVWKTLALGIPGSAPILGIEAEVRAFLGGTGTVGADCTLGVDFSWDAGTTWSTQVQTAALTATKTTLPILGSSSTTADWGAHAWTQAEFGTNFRLRLTWNRGSCGTSQKASVDTLRLRVTYTATTTATATTTPTSATPGSGYDLKGPGDPCSNVTTGAPTDCYQPNGSTLSARGFWGAMNTKGIGSNNGDAFQSAKDPSGSTAPNCNTVSGLRTCYDPTNYYNYAIEMPAGSTNGYVYVFDAVFCDQGSSYGVGDGQSSGSLSTTYPPSSWYEIFDTNDTAYTNTDDTLITTTGSKFVDMKFSDSTMGGAMPSGSLDCKQKDSAYGDGRDYHDNWILLNPTNPLNGGADGKTYRLHTTNSTPAGQTDPINQMNVGTEQNFAIYANASGGTPRIYGLGAMEMYTPIVGAGTSQFYLAQIPAYYAGKTLELNLWDAGDTGGLTAKLYVMQPSTTVGTWNAVNFNYTAGSAAGSCSASPTSGSNVGYVATNSFNACWLTVQITIPTGYTAPQDGWWQLKYSLTGSGSSVDTTTWTAHILGNPVHLVVP